MEDMNLISLSKYFDDEAEAWKLIEDLRWPDGQPVCPKCGVKDDHYFLKPKSKTGGRKTRTGAKTVRRVWKCKACRKQFSALVGTIFHGTKIELRKWLAAIYLMCSAKNGVSAHEIHRDLDVSYKSAWYMCHRIREAMTREPMTSMLRGTIQADETYVGGKKRPGRDAKPKNAVVSVLEQGGRVRSRAVPNVTSDSLFETVLDSADPKGSRLFTDEHRGYQDVGSFFENGHEKVWHSGGEYARGEVTTNHVEGYFSRLKRSLNGTYLHVSKEHLHRYLGEFDFRWNTRKMSDGQRMKELFGHVMGRRITYFLTTST